MKESLLDIWIELLTESLTRKLDRRRALFQLSRSGFLLLSSAVLGMTMRELDAQGVCTACDPPNNRYCDAMGKPCPDGPGCPQGCTVCLKGQGTECIYSQGFWTICTDIPGFGAAEIVCYDCKCGPVFTDTCGCKSKPMPAFDCGSEGGDGCTKEPPLECPP